MMVRSSETDLWRFELRATPAERLIEAGYFGANPVWHRVQNPPKKGRRDLNFPTACCHMTSSFERYCRKSW
jgi:hypothetical protein